MQRDMKIVIEIMETLAKSASSVFDDGYVCIKHEMPDDMYYRMFPGENPDDEEPSDGYAGKENPDPYVVIIPATICSREATVYHLDIMKESGLITKSPVLKGQPYYRLSWDGNDFLDTFQQEGVLERIESKHGDDWRHWGFDIAKSVFTELSKRLILQSMGGQ